MDKACAAAAEMIDRFTMLRPGQRVLAAVSGGADSVALLHILRELQYDVAVCHVNHGLRGEESDRDEAFVHALCEKNGIPIIVKRLSGAELRQIKGESLETAARTARYAALQQAAEKMQAEKIATAHTADDNAETMLFHLLRGTGRRGLCGIPPVRGNIIRPLLGLTREQVESYLAERQQPYVTDSSNASTVYSRNLLRQRVMPVLRQINPAAVQNILRTALLLREEEDMLDAEADTCLRTAGNEDEGFLIAPLKELPPYLQNRTLRTMLNRSGVPAGRLGKIQIDQLSMLLENPSPSARLDLPDGFCVFREYDRLKITKKSEKASVAEPIDISLPFDGLFGTTYVNIQKNNRDIYNSFNTFSASCDTINISALVLRTRQTGDRIRLTKNGGSATLKKLMIDRKIPLYKRDALAVLCDDRGVIAVEDIGIDISRVNPAGEQLHICFEGDKKHHGEGY